ncbi:hypothetical protein FA13DRAFT_1735916 [Coprinellus micaceus]|uniref:Uncharacterized protein n=1 Tax=Coprinellus micaceus TaxID=71717 RepID=A0A4Y7T243_COPMI|nr:hypothetical protein FA13DRAFT_1735916 [Coprinellus micaceus]
MGREDGACDEVEVRGDGLKGGMIEVRSASRSRQGACGVNAEESNVMFVKNAAIMNDGW